MKKNIFKLCFIGILLQAINFAKSDNAQLEIYFYNDISNEITVHAYPIGMIMNGYSQYNLIAKRPTNTTYRRFDYIDGVRIDSGNKRLLVYVLGGYYGGFNYEGSAEPPAGATGSYGSGVYKIIFDWGSGSDTVLYEQDGGIHYDIQFHLVENTTSFGGPGGKGLTYKSIDSNQFWGPEKWIGLSYKYIKCWEPYPYDTSQASRDKDFGNFIYDGGDISTLENPYTVFPQDSRADCNLEYYPDQRQDFTDVSNILLTLKLTIDKDIYTRDTLLNNPTNVVVTKKAELRLRQNRTFDMITPSSPSGGYTNLIVQDSAILGLHNAQIIIRSPNRLTLEYGSHLVLGSAALITIESGAQFCNYGGIIQGYGKIWYKGGFHSFCRPDNGIITFEDSTNVILDSNAVLEVPDSTTLKFKGSQTALRLYPTSKLKMGVNSKLVFEDGARMISRNSTLIAKDTTKKWKGIFSYDNATDSITDTKIVNAEEGINIVDNFSDRKIIKDCEFINKSSSNLSSCINVYNSSRTLIRGNHFYSETSSNFDNAIYLEYCTSDELIVVDNAIEDATNAIIDIGSWSYIARNTITGDESTGFGITLDNYSGTIKYNSVENFKYSLYTLVSDAYLYRNIFRNASTVNLELESYSTPLLRPVQSDELKYWLGGDNIIDISGAGVGINLVDESYPLIKDGYNKFYLNDADYFITGAVPSEFEDSLEARNNYWNASVNSSKFDISNTTVKYNPTEDGSPGNRYYNTSFLMNMGFDVIDTLYIHDESDNPVITDLFLLGNNKVLSGDYEDAIEDFKEVVTSKDSVFTNLALKKIYYCYERSNFFSSNYTDAKNYFNGINTDTNYSTTSRAIARDLYLKVKFKNGEYESSEEEYNTIYQNNINNSLGLHALINKTILENLVSGDNISSGTSLENLSEHKRNVFELLSPNPNSARLARQAKKGKPDERILLSEYKLEQNFPNPFNPTTKINYSIPNNGYVTLKIFDILGKEIITLVNEFKQSGKYEVIFNGNNISSGIYYYKIESGNFSEVRKMILIK